MVPSPVVKRAPYCTPATPQCSTSCYVHVVLHATLIGVLHGCCPSMSGNATTTLVWDEGSRIQFALVRFFLSKPS